MPTRQTLSPIELWSTLAQVYPIWVGEVGQEEEGKI